VYLVVVFMASKTLVTSVDSLTQFTVDLLRYSAAEAKYCEYLCGGVTAEEDKMLRQENMAMKQQLEKLTQEVSRLTLRVGQLESQLGSGGAMTKPCSAPSPAQVEKDEDDDVDLFGSDEEEDDAEAAKIKEQRVAEYAAKKSQKAKVIAKSNVILDVKPWDDETDMKELENCVRSVVMDGLLWGTSKLVPVGYGIKKLQISTVVEDDKVSVDELVDKIQEFEDFIQSVDIAAFNKI